MNSGSHPLREFAPYQVLQVCIYNAVVDEEVWVKSDKPRVPYFVAKDGRALDCAGSFACVSHLRRRRPANRLSKSPFSSIFVTTVAKRRVLSIKIELEPIPFARHVPRVNAVYFTPR